MGAEDFGVVLNTSEFSFNEVIEDILYVENITIDKETTHIDLETYYIYNDGNHLIEIQVSQYGDKNKFVEISCRFALCHPSSIDDVFYDFISLLGNKFKMKIEIMKEVPAGFPDIFYYPEYIGFLNSLKITIKQFRNYWILDFGSETASLRPSEAINKFVLNR